mgnify:CR=1 FL=1
MQNHAYQVGETVGASKTLGIAPDMTIKVLVIQKGIITALGEATDVKSGEVLPAYELSYYGESGELLFENVTEKQITGTVPATIS